jgi:cytidyltransferase-like protein
MKQKHFSCFHCDFNLPHSSHKGRLKITPRSPMKKKRVVLFQGAWEILNYGHVRAFRRAKQLGDVLILALNTNKLLRKYKGREPVLPWQHKATILRAIKYVDMVVPAHCASPLPLLKKYDADVFVLTREWEHAHADSIAYMKAKGGKVYFSRRYAGVVATSEIKRVLLLEAQHNHDKGDE